MAKLELKEEEKSKLDPLFEEITEGEEEAEKNKLKTKWAIAKRFKVPFDSLNLIIVRNMWLTGIDCPSMHTMYLDKPMNGHNLMQAIARMNRVIKDQPGGLVVDYLGIADALKHALHTYTASGGKRQATVDQEQATAVMIGFSLGRDAGCLMTSSEKYSIIAIV